MSLTIGICAFNEERNIGPLLQDVLDQESLPKDVKIIVVASGCTDKTPTIVREIATDHSNVQLITEQIRSGKTHAINQILRECQSKLLLMVDADIRLPRDCLGEVLRGFVDDGTGVVGALPIVGNSENGLIARSASIVWRVMRRALIELHVRQKLSFVMGEVYCFRTDLVDSIPDGIVNDDAYVAMLSRTSGLEVILAPKAKFIVRVPTSISDYIAQRRRVTFGHLQLRIHTGRFATSMEGIALHHPSILVRVMVHESASHPLSIIRSLLILELELAVRLLAWLDIRAGRGHKIWRRIGTTK